MWVNTYYESIYFPQLYPLQVVSALKVGFPLIHCVFSTIYMVLIQQK